MIVMEELEGSEAKEGKRRGSSTSIFSSILPPTEVVIVDVGPVAVPHEGKSPPVVDPFSHLMSEESSSKLDPCDFSILQSSQPP